MCIDEQIRWILTLMDIEDIVGPCSLEAHSETFGHIIYRIGNVY